MIVSTITCRLCYMCELCFFFFNDTATTEIYTLSLHDALPISPSRWGCGSRTACRVPSATSGSSGRRGASPSTPSGWRSEEHTSELQSRQYLVCRLLLEKKKKVTKYDVLRTKVAERTERRMTAI